jgi:hypothetical protein
VDGGAARPPRCGAAGPGPPDPDRAAHRRRRVLRGVRGADAVACPRVPAAGGRARRARARDPEAPGGRPRDGGHPGRRAPHPRPADLLRLHVGAVPGAAVLPAGPAAHLPWPDGRRAAAGAPAAAAARLAGDACAALWPRGAGGAPGAVDGGRRGDGPSSPAAAGRGRRRRRRRRPGRRSRQPRRGARRGANTACRSSCCARPGRGPWHRCATTKRF